MPSLVVIGIQIKKKHIVPIQVTKIAQLEKGNSRYKPLNFDVQN